MRLNCRQNRPLAHYLGRFLNRGIDGGPCRATNYLAQACTLILEARKKVTDAALEKVYGPSPPCSPLRPSVWTERYCIPPDGMKIHRRWFRENYGD